ncbi:efflux transporter outer membrane subunit [Sphingosinicella sp. BN140058]|uniref:efflux transporter outer membrane subunit n=1 Tax=Sphingosinicella sp. BN140058 TaxID=1892855 RepID=UPI001012998F|nr:efflux transporter outer membrane subunit [Sphingosinicella sp. BN140058]QAY77439.1 efflux transporter outer membrane subunit [Sphingosinicella sp. BN140058]
MRLPAALTLVLLAAGCAGRSPAPVPAEAAVNAPAAWRTSAGPTAPIERQWWQAFGDPVLAALIERALANNPDIGTAAARVREARAQERLARSQLVPSLDLGAGTTYGRSVSALGQPTESVSVQPLFQAAYELDLFGRIDQQVAAARAGTAAAEAGRETVTLSIAAATASGYITLRGLDARLGIVRETLASRAEALRIARNRAEVGYTSELELRQAEAEYEATAQIVPQVALAVSRQENALSQLLGESPRAIERGVTLAALRQPPIPDGLPADLLRRRPDIAQAEFTLAASDATLASARAQFLPQIRLTGTAGGVLSSALGDPISLWSLGGSILAPIFNGGRIQAQVDTAAARRDQAAFAYRRTALVAFREVEDNLAAVRRLAEQRVRLEAQRRAVAEALRHATNRYQAGYSPYLEQLDAQRALLNVELTLIQIEADQLNALVALYQAMGGGWTGLAMSAQ